MWWKIYFWIFLIFTVIGAFSLLQYTPFALIDFILMGLELILLLGVFGYSYKKPILNPRFWRYIFWASLFFTCLNILDIFILPEGLLIKLFPILESNIPTNKEDALLAIILTMPYLYVAYKLSSHKPQKNSKK